MDLYDENHILCWRWKNDRDKCSFFFRGNSEARLYGCRERKTAVMYTTKSSQCTKVHFRILWIFMKYNLISVRRNTKNKNKWMKVEYMFENFNLVYLYLQNKLYSIWGRRTLLTIPRCTIYRMECPHIIQFHDICMQTASNMPTKSTKFWTTNRSDVELNSNS